MWFMLLRKGRLTDLKNLLASGLNLSILLNGLFILVAGKYSCVRTIVCLNPALFQPRTNSGQVNKYHSGSVGGVFSCSLAGG